MSLGGFFKSMFSGSPGQRSLPDPVEYKEFSIQADPLYEDGKYRTAGYISGERNGEQRQVRFIRADQHGDEQAAIEHALQKGRQIIDEQGPSLLDRAQL